VNIGDLVHKESGNDAGKLGIILSVITNSRENTIVNVLSEGDVRSWYALYVAVISESR